MEFVIISGLSGAGKSKAASFLEDMGFFCVDNLPVPLIPKLAELIMAGSGVYERVALVSDIRGGQNPQGLLQALDTMLGMRCSYKILFIEAGDDTIIKRYKETRRSHPLAHGGASLEEAVRAEREALAPVRARADHIIDTTALSTAKLRGNLMELFGSGERAREMSVSVISFGFKYGLPIEADLVFDVRFLPNPYYVEELREHTGLEPAVRDYVMQGDQAERFLAKLNDLVDFLLPQYVEEGKTALVIAVGCTGGRHRSVAVTRALADHIKELGYQAVENHRDMTRG